MQQSASQQQIRVLPIMIAIFFGSFISTLNISTINIAIPVLSEHFHASLSTIQWTLTGFMLAMGTFAPITGYFGERFSYKRLYIFALSGFMAASICCALAWSPESLIVFRIMQGAFSGLITPATMAIVYQVIPREKQPMAISFWAASSMLAPAIGPTFSGWLLDNVSWHWLFWVNVPIAAIGIMLVIPFIPYYRLNVPKSFDFIGFITVIISSASLLVALSNGHTWGWTGGKTLALIAIGAVFLLLFIWRELTCETPLLNLRVFRISRYTISLTLTSIVTISLYSGTFLSPVFLQNIQHVSPLDTGLILLPASLAMALMTPIVGKLFTRIGPRPLLIIGVLLMAGGTLPLSWLSVDIPHGYILFWMIVRNLGISFAMMPASNAGMEAVPKQFSGHASSLTNWIRNVLGSFAIAVFTTLLSSRTVDHGKDLAKAGASDPTSIKIMAFTMSVNDVYLIATIIVIVALPVAFFIPKLKREPVAEKIAA
ncbi:EmrB/QacA subfamily drug resistance transporter [Paenibacillus taihuensis]|uniref:EmrB/QacA subfamily drug resistance transporter n=1 Tax=Paenibacillus taihuensis TaxID=1156355 RepID=A0A3D9SCV2_9BACL|nr:MDR family MFS transporter [Paenibacillus taihuensis]REE91422.1 EmrB/QacA subfamily drug resistance transporter [Paenibacillus taihuensis]